MGFAVGGLGAGVGFAVDSCAGVEGIGCELIQESPEFVRILEGSQLAAAQRQGVALGGSVAFSD